MDEKQTERLLTTVDSIKERVIRIEEHMVPDASERLVVLESKMRLVWGGITTSFCAACAAVWALIKS